MATRDARVRARARGGGARWVVLGCVCLVVLGATFLLGVVAGRRATAPGRVASDGSAAKPAPPPRRSGLVDVLPDHLPPQEKLTFYKTLTAPLPPGARTAPGARPGEERGRALTARGHEQLRAPSGDGRAAPLAAPAMVSAPVSARPGAVREASPDEPNGPPVGSWPGQELRPAGRGEPPDATARSAPAPASPEWTVQVGVFSSSRTAEGVKRQLAARGFTAQVAPAPAGDGQMRYRVHVGSFGTRDEAIRLAERVRSGPSLPTYVTTR